MKELLRNVQKYISRSFKMDNLIQDDPAKVSFPDEQYETPIKRYTKSELADLYDRSVYTLMRWIHNNRQLMEELQVYGYKKSQKEFRKEQVRLIFKHLGEP